MSKRRDWGRERRRQQLKEYDAPSEQCLDVIADRWMREAGDGRRPGPREPKEDSNHKVSGWLVTCAFCSHRAEINQPLEVMQRAKLRCSNCKQLRAPAQATNALPWESEHAEA